MKKLSYFIFSSLFSVLVLLAAFSVRPACNFISYQPELPKSLRK
ncbi:MAG: cyclic lactone autoinducer peptide [Eubacteriales bacterium]|jgi:cyclic lactone autoinducer peptide